MPENTEKPAPGIPGASDQGDEIVEDLKLRLEESRLPGATKQQIIAGLPSAEEAEEQYREMQKGGGFSFDQLFDDEETSTETSR